MALPEAVVMLEAAADGAASLTRCWLSITSRKRHQHHPTPQMDRFFVLLPQAAKERGYHSTQVVLFQCQARHLE